MRPSKRKPEKELFPWVLSEVIKIAMWEWAEHEKRQ